MARPRHDNDVPSITPELLTMPQAAKALQVSRTTVYKLAKEGRLKVVDVGDMRVSRAEITAFIARTTRRRRSA
jgi:excisionase family DNA binding protein